MAFMRSTVAYGLFWINLLASIFILIFWIQDPSEPYILYIDIVAILFVILLMISFCLTHNECCSPDPATNEYFAIGSCYGACICCDKCDCSGGGNNCEVNGDGALGLLIFIVCIIIFVAIYYVIRGCGKHISKLFSVFVLMIAELAMAIMSFIISSDISGMCYILIAVFSLIAAICNFLGLLLPNLDSCEYLSFSDYIPPKNENNNTQINNTPSAQPFIQPAAPTYPPNIVQVPPQQQMVPIYNQPGQTYNNGSGNIYDTSSNWYNPQNYYGNVPPPANEQYPKPNNK